MLSLERRMRLQLRHPREARATEPLRVQHPPYLGAQPHKVARQRTQLAPRLLYTGEEPKTDAVP